MSVEALQTQIDTISQDIERQKDVLRKLERSKSLLQRQLNSLRDPIARLPLEISSEIFVQCLPQPPIGGVPLIRVPMLLLNICNTWTDIALCSPALWTRIDFELPCSRDFQELLARWLDRAGGHGLHICVRGSLNRAVASIIWSHYSHLEHLELWAEDRDDSESDGGGISSDRDLLGGTRPEESFPRLKYLKIHGRPDLAFLKLPVLRLLRLSPDLATLDFGGFQFAETSETSEDWNTVLSSLDTLFLNGSSLDAFRDHSILRYTSAPNLHTLGLCIPSDTEDSADIIAFLERSSPPLQKLLVAEAGDFDAFNAILPRVPSVTHLELNWPGEDLMLQFIPSLAHSPRDILPTLQSLDIRYTLAVPWDAILGALSARRTQIRSMRMTYFESPSSNPAPLDLLASLRDLVAGGMDISILAIQHHGGRRNILDSP